MINLDCFEFIPIRHDWLNMPGERAEFSAGLTRILHELTAAGQDTPSLTSLRSRVLLDVRSKNTCGPPVASLVSRAAQTLTAGTHPISGLAGAGAWASPEPGGCLGTGKARQGGRDGPGPGNQEGRPTKMESVVSLSSA